MTADRRRILLRERRVAPSILSADFGHLVDQVEKVLDAGARVIHVDVMDGQFVPPITFGAVAVEAIADRVHEAGGLVDVHMMVDRPERHVEDIAHAGADNITIHVEATPHVHYTLQTIRELGCSAGAAICPATPIEALGEVARETLDLALCMTVNPGWGGQKFIPASIDKVDRLRRLVPDNVAVEVDGGIHQDTAEAVIRAGANLLVAGSAVFASGDPAATYQAIVQAAGSL
jgi:ribulose-phosphate 3-epimerase